jgi:hypothetical protein
MKKLFPPLVLFPFLINLAFSGGVLRGIVHDSLSGSRLGAVNVVVKGTALGATTNTSGFYLIPNIPLGKYTITASLVGYLPSSKELTVRRDTVLTLNFRLRPAPIELEEIPVAAQQEERMEPKAIGLKTLSAEEIALIPPALQKDLFRALELLPGVSGTGDVGSQFYVRGGREDQNLILLDGIPIYNPFHALGLFSVFDPQMIKAVRVYTSNYPAEYGERLSSVVDVRMKSGNANRVSGSADLNLLSGSMLLEGPLSEGSSWIVSGRRSYFDQSLKKFLRKQLPLAFYDAFANVLLKVGEFGSFAFKGFTSTDELREVNATDPRYEWRNSAFAASYSSTLAETMFAEALAWHSGFEARRESKQGTTITPLRNQVQDGGVRANVTSYLENGNQLVLGFLSSFPQTLYELVNSAGQPVTLESTMPIFDTWVSYQCTSGIRMSHQTSTLPVKFDLGLRARLASLFSGSPITEVLEPRIFGAIDLTPTLQLKGSFASFHQQLVTVTNEDDLVPLFEAWITVPEGLGDEEVDHYLIAGEWAFSPLSKISFSTYYKVYHGLVFYNRDKVDQHDPDYTSGSGNSLGLEVSWQRETKSISTRLNYTLAWAQVDNAGLTYHPRYDRRHLLDAVFMFRTVSGWTFGGRWEYASGLPFTAIKSFYDRLTLGDLFQTGYGGETGEPYAVYGPKNGARLPAYHRLDISVSKVFSFNPVKLMVSVNVINVYNRRNIFYFDSQTGEQVNMLPFFPTVEVNIQY